MIYVGGCKKMKKPNLIENTIFSGKRKRAIAKLKLKAGNGRVFYNYLSYEELGLFHKLALTEPIRIYNQELGEDLKYDFYIKTMGGGKEGQLPRIGQGGSRYFYI